MATSIFGHGPVNPVALAVVFLVPPNFSDRVLFYGRRWWSSFQALSLESCQSVSRVLSADSAVDHTLQVIGW